VAGAVLDGPAGVAGVEAAGAAGVEAVGVGDDVPDGAGGVACPSPEP
jgi:hypothetical protein